MGSWNLKIFDLLDNTNKMTEYQYSRKDAMKSMSRETYCILVTSVRRVLKLCPQTAGYGIICLFMIYYTLKCS